MRWCAMGGALRHADRDIGRRKTLARRKHGKDAFGGPLIRGEDEGLGRRKKTGASLRF